MSIPCLATDTSGRMFFCLYSESGQITTVHQVEPQNIVKKYYPKKKYVFESKAVCLLDDPDPTTRLIPIYDVLNIDLTTRETTIRNGNQTREKIPLNNLFFLK